MKHPKHIKGYENNINGLAQDICNLDYTVLAELMYNISEIFEEDALEDRNRDRHKLFRELYTASNHLQQAWIYINNAAHICKP